MTEPLIPRITEEQFLKLTPEKQEEYIRLYREQVAPKLEIFRKPAPYKLSYIKNTISAIKTQYKKKGYRKNPISPSA